MSGEQQMHPRVEQAKVGIDFFIKLAAFLSILVGGTTWATGIARPTVQEWFGITEIRTSLEALGARVAKIEPKKTVLRFDSHVSGQYSENCVIGETCIIKVSANRTRHGKDCGMPHVSPHVFNGGGSKHSAEFIGDPPPFDHMRFTPVLWLFRVPINVTPGRGHFSGVINWDDCPFGNATQKVPLIPVEFIAPLDATDDDG